MSKVISFRLNPENPREAEALTILESWISQGFSTRHTLTEALLMLDSRNSRPLDNEAFKDLSRQIQELIARVEMGATHKIMDIDTLSKPELSNGFVSSIVRTAKPGMKKEE